MAAETGSGKTGAFSLPVIQAVWETKNGGLLLISLYYHLLAYVWSLPALFRLVLSRRFLSKH